MDKTFLKTVLAIAIPVSLQGVIMASLNMTDQVMIGQLGDASISAVGISNKLFRILLFVLTGIASGVSIYVAQYWGSKDRSRVKQVLGLGLVIGGAICLPFAIMIFFFNQQIMSLFTKDMAIIEAGSIYLQIVSLSYIPMMLTVIYSAVLRSTRHAQLPMIMSGVSVGLNVLLNYMLIFGNFGLPELGIQGAAVGTFIARTIEFTMMLAIIYVRRLPGAYSILNVFQIDKVLMKKFAITTYPIVLTEFFWATGEATYGVVYGRMGTSEITAMAVSEPIQLLSIGLASGIASAATVLVGNLLGGNQNDEAFLYAKRLFKMGLIVTISLSGLIILCASVYVSLYQISPEAHDLSIAVIIVFALLFWVKVSNMIVAHGVLASGGDTKYLLVIDTTTTWGFGVPVAFISAFMFGLPVYWVYFLLTLEEVIRLGLGLRRLYSKKWIRNLVEPQKDISG
ncbi:MATE family efflux transporter [Bacillus sp. A301a_S52]|nr:MATE family efflux transporter [Bacillus sp. A301a_S52]